MVFDFDSPMSNWFNDEKVNFMLKDFEDYKLEAIPLVAGRLNSYVSNLIFRLSFSVIYFNVIFR